MKAPTYIDYLRWKAALEVVKQRVSESDLDWVEQLERIVADIKSRCPHADVTGPALMVLHYAQRAGLPAMRRYWHSLETAIGIYLTRRQRSV